MEFYIFQFLSFSGLFRWDSWLPTFASLWVPVRAVISFMGNWACVLLPVGSQLGGSRYKAVPCHNQGSAASGPEKGFLYVVVHDSAGICLNFSAEGVLNSVPGILHLLCASGFQRFCMRWCFCMHAIPLRRVKVSKSNILNTE